MPYFTSNQRRLFYREQGEGPLWTAIECPERVQAVGDDSLLPNVATQMCNIALQHSGSRVCFGSAGNHPLMWSQPGEFRSVADWFLSGFGCPIRR